MSARAARRGPGSTRPRPRAWLAAGLVALAAHALLWLSWEGPGVGTGTPGAGLRLSLNTGPGTGAGRAGAGLPDSAAGAAAGGAPAVASSDAGTPSDETVPARLPRAPAAPVPGRDGSRAAPPPGPDPVATRTLSGATPPAPVSTAPPAPRRAATATGPDAGTPTDETVRAARGDPTREADGGGEAGAGAVAAAGGRGTGGTGIGGSGPGAPGDGRAGEGGDGGGADPAGDAYFERLFRSARRSLERRYPRTADQGVVVLRVRIDRGGGVARCDVAESSGSRELDRAAVRGFRRAAPFGPVPDGVSDRDLVFDYPVEYERLGAGS